MNKAALTAVIVASIFGALALAAPTRNNRAGAQLTYALNGSLRHVVNLTTYADAGLTELTGWDDGAMAYTYCDVATYQINLKVDAGDATVAKAVPVAAATLHPIGVLRAGTPVVSIASQASGGAACRGFVSE